MTTVSHGAKSFEDGSAQQPLLDQEILERAFANALAAFFPTLPAEKNVDPRTDFYALYQKESDEFDKEFIKRYEEDLNTTLIFAGLFSAVASTFIIDIQVNLQPNYNQLTAALLKVLIHAIDTSTFAGIDLTPPEWVGPPSILITVQSILYSSLFASLLAAFGAMLGKQWLNRYARVQKRGSLIQRSRDRQRKWEGMISWRFELIMSSLPIILQAALLLLGYALSQYVLTIDSTVGTVIIIFTSLGALFYVFVVVSATISYDCPYQTPLSIMLRSLITGDFGWKRTKCTKHIRGLVRSLTDHLPFFVASAKPGRYISKWSNFIIRSFAPRNGGVSEWSRPNDIVQLFDDTSIHRHGHASDARCITWLLETSTDVDVAVSAMRFVPEVEWHSGIESIPFVERFCDLLEECFDPAGEVVNPGMVAKAHVASKSLVHLFIQRRCAENWQFPSDFRKYMLLRGESDRHDNLEPALHMFLMITKNADVRWSAVEIPETLSPTHQWMCHILTYQVWEYSEYGAVPMGVYDFLQWTLSCHPSLPSSMVADCLLMVGMTIGMRVKVDDLLVVDKSKAIHSIVGLLYAQLNKALLKPTSPEGFHRFLVALRTLLSWKNHNITLPGLRLSYDLCRNILNSQMEDTVKWESTRWALQIGFRTTGHYEYEWENSGGVITFLEHHFYLQQTGEGHFDSIADAFVALSRAPQVAPADFDFSKGLLIQGMFSSLKADKPIRLRRTSLLFVHWAKRQLFDLPEDVMDVEKRSELFSDMAAVGTELEPQPNHVEFSYFEILLASVKSDVWRPHLHLNQWRILGPLSTRYVSDHLTECLTNRALIPTLVQAGDWEIVKLWLIVVWRQFFELLPPHLVTEIRATTQALFCGEGREAVMDEFRTVWDELHLLHLTAGDEAALETVRQRRQMMDELMDYAKSGKYGQF